MIESLRADMVALHKAGAIDLHTVHTFDTVCPSPARPVRTFSASEIKGLRETLQLNQPMFAHHLHISIATVRKWEQGITRPAGSALKLLNVIADKGLQVLL